MILNSKVRSCVFGDLMLTPFSRIQSSHSDPIVLGGRAEKGIRTRMSGANGSTKRKKRAFVGFFVYY